MLRYSLVFLLVGFFCSPSWGQTCNGQVVDNLYRSIGNALCSTDYAWSLVSRVDRPRVYNKNLCALSYLTAGAAATSVGIGVALRDAADRSDSRVIKNTSRNRQRLETLLRQNRSIYDQDILHFMKKYPNHHIIAEREWNRFKEVRKGPHKMKSAALAAGRRLVAGTIVMGLAAPAMIVLDPIIGSTSTGCSEFRHQYYSADRENRCRAENPLAPKVLRFLSLDEKDQLQILKQDPKLCDVYAELSEKLDQEMREHFSGEMKAKCNGSENKVYISWAGNSDSSKVRLRGDSAFIQTRRGKTLHIEYAVDRFGRRHVKSVKGQIKMTSARDTSKVHYQAPFTDYYQDVRFQNTMKEVVRHTQLLDSEKAFSACRPHSSTSEARGSSLHPELPAIGHR